ncbi:MAG TPA: PAS domain-containing sensor histidine kinase [Puia sp.]|nr:PAS domain-containing sensor histidine kinase [Puia sp.]
MSNSKESAFKIDVFFEMTPDLVCVAGKDGFFKKVNPAVIAKLGYTEKELMANPIATYIHPEDKHLTKERRTELLNGKALVNFQNRYITKTGEIVWLEWTSIYFAEREVVFAIAKDITKRKITELEIEQKYKKFKSLTAHFKSSIEEDRKYLANELHEELAQLASVLKMDIEYIKNSEPDWPLASRSRIEHALGISNLLIKTIRRISFSISPNMLEHLGLSATLNWHCKEFSILNGVPCSFESSYDEADLSEETKIDLFRICQESLMNILLHAQANHVKITLEEMCDRIQLTVQDDGKGFAVDKQKRKSGLVRMRERAASINGQLTIQSAIGMGTQVRISVAKQ